MSLFYCVTNALVETRNIFSGTLLGLFGAVFRHEIPIFGISRQFREKQVKSQSVFRHVRPISLECVQDRKQRSTSTDVHLAKTCEEILLTKTFNSNTRSEIPLTQTCVTPCTQIIACSECFSNLVFGTFTLNLSVFGVFGISRLCRKLMFLVETC